MIRIKNIEDLPYKRILMGSNSSRYRYADKRVLITYEHPDELSTLKDWLATTFAPETYMVEYGSQILFADEADITLFYLRYPNKI